MFCCYKKNKIIPYEKTIHSHSYKEQPKTTKEFTEMFLGEVLTCGTCKKSFSLRQNEVVAYCGGCYKFLHCGIAGKCVGPNCKFNIRGEIYKQTWCLSCIPKNYIINIQNIGNPTCDCLCLECSDDPTTPNKYKSLI